LALAAEPFVVGIGASAGGIEALEGLFRHTPADAGLAFVVVTHLDPTRESMLPEVVSRFTTLPVGRAEDGAALERDRVHVAGPGAVLAVEGGRLRVRAALPGGRHHDRHPIDTFLSSLADDLGERAIAVILSGGGHDGALGLKAVKERGGLTVAQGVDGSAPRHASMPSSAISTGLVDLVLPVEQIGGKLADYVGSFGALAALTATGEGDPGRPALDPRAAVTLQSVHALLHDQVGHDFRGYKQKTFMRRVQRRMQVLQLTDLDAYAERLGREPAEVVLLFRDLLIGVTSFFRDRDAFDALERLVVPRLFEGKAAGERLRAWVPGCSTGEEAYSIAMLLRERADAMRLAPRIEVVATDIDDGALAIARGARYPEAFLAGVAPERLERFFTAAEGTYTVDRQLRDVCIFSSHSLIRDPPFSRMDLVSCRNLLIYLNGDSQAQVFPAFHYALRPGGFLFLGNSEAVTQHGDLFAPLDKKARLFQRRDHVGSPLRLSAFRPGLRPVPAIAGEGDTTAARRGPPPSDSALRRAAEERVLERFAPAHVVVDREGDVIYYSPRTGKYLEAPPGQPSRQLLLMARKGLRLDLRTALHHAMTTRNASARARVALDAEDRGGVQLVDLTVEPLAGQAAADPLFLVIFEDAGPPLGPDEVARRARLPADADADADAEPRSSASCGTRASGSSRRSRSTRSGSRNSSPRMRSWYQSTRSCNRRTRSSRPARKRSKRSTRI
jgi:two-component system CheB/CheR fusion protein